MARNFKELQEKMDPASRSGNGSVSVPNCDGWLSMRSASPSN